MAIYSLHHSVIGKSTQERPHTAVAHVRYITRESACSQTLGARLPTQVRALQGWLQEAENQDRKNARICDKLMLALPRELDARQRAELIREFGEGITVGRAAWFAAIHQDGKDSQNPHCHLMVRDRDFETGKRVINTSEKGSTERFREAWEAACNAALARARSTARVSRRTLKAQGLSRAPTIHEGVRARQVAARRRTPRRSRAINVPNAITARSRFRMIDYGLIDQGRSRLAFNGELYREAEREAWAAVDADRRERERALQTKPERKRLVATAKARVLTAMPARKLTPTATRPPVDYGRWQDDGPDLGSAPYDMWESDGAEVPDLPAPHPAPVARSGFDRARFLAKLRADRQQGRSRSLDDEDDDEL